MKTSTIVLVQLFVIFAIISVHECRIEDPDAIMFSDEIEVSPTIEKTEQQGERLVEQEIEREDKKIRDNDVIIDNRNIITVPERHVCPTCQRLDSRGICRKIQGCVP